MVNNSRALDNPHNVIKTSYLCPTECLLKKTKAPVGLKLRVPHNKKGHCDLLIQANHHSPRQILHYKPVLILPGTVVAVKMQVGLS